MADEMRIQKSRADSASCLTERQIEYVAAFRMHQSNRDACRALGVTYEHGMNQIRDAIGRSGLSDVALIGRSLRTRRADKKQVAATASDLYSLVKAQNFRCALSGRKLKADDAALDHKIPMSMGGTDSIENLQWVDDVINRAKGTMTNEQFINMCREVAKWNN